MVLIEGAHGVEHGRAQDRVATDADERGLP